MTNYEEKNMDRIEKEELWSGKTSEKLNLKYKELSGCYPYVIESLQNYINFLSDTLNKYSELENKLNSNLENASDDLTVNTQ